MYKMDLLPLGANVSKCDWYGDLNGLDMLLEYSVYQNLIFIAIVQSKTKLRCNTVWCNKQTKM